MPFKIINKKDKILKSKLQLFNRFNNKVSNIYILGVNKWADKLILYCNEKKINISGIIDDYSDKQFYNGLQVLKTEDISDKDSLIVSCVIDGKLITAFRNLNSKGLYNILSYLELCLFDEKLSRLNFLSDSEDDIVRNLEEYAWLEEKLDDEVSKETLKNIIDFRLNFNIEAMKIFTYNLEKQYFDDFIKFNDEEIFIDCGGFDGETTRKFIQLCPSYKSIYYFEPIKEYFEESKQCLKQYERISFFNKGTYKEHKVLNFVKTGPESKISEIGDEKLEVVRLDDVINDKVTYIKMDVEGSEYESLIGCEKIIKNYKPKLAICVYHKQSDFWRIPKLILQYNPNYKIYLRHYTEGILETVMYFL